MNPGSNSSSVGLELRLARTARPDSAAEPRKRSAGADQSWQQVFQLRQFDLQLAFAGSRASREDVENELRAIDDLTADFFFDLPELRRRELVVEHDHVDVGLGGGGGQCRHLPRSEKGRRIGLEPLLQAAHTLLFAGRHTAPWIPD